MTAGPVRVAGVALAALVAACTGGGSPAPVVPSPDPLAVLTRAGNAAPAVEFCNGLDDDGNGFADERYACVRGAVESCVTPCNSWGTHTCSVACTWGDCAPGAELCNGQDDDCDGRADEDFGCVAGTTTLCDAQPRGKGVSRCDEHCVPTPCDPVPRELCNATDDDGDGRVDEDFECAWGQREVCDPAAGTDRICTTRCTWAPCGKAETCNYQDDDADGKTDEGFTYRWERPPFDVPDVARQGEEVYEVLLPDCSDEQIVVLTNARGQGQPRIAPSLRGTLMRFDHDGRLLSPPTVICEVQRDIVNTWAQNFGGARIAGDRVIAMCATRTAQDDYGHRLVAVDSNGRIAWTRDTSAVASSGAFVAGDRIVWPTWHWVERDMELYITVLDRDGLVRLPRTSLGIRSTGGLDLTPIVTDENGTALYVVKGSSYLPGAVGVWRVYLDLDTGAILREQELNPGRGDLENVIDGPGVTLVSNSGGVRSVYDDAGRMVGNKIFFGQGPNPFGMRVGRTFGTVFLLPWGGVNAERITFDGRRSDTTFWFDHSPEPDIPGGADGLSTWIHSSGGCVTPRGRYIGYLGSNTLEVPGRDGPFRRIYITGCGE